MIFLSSRNLRLVIYLSIGLHSLVLLTECEKIRLVGPSRCAGRVEIFHQDSWGTVCDDLWNISNAEVVCRELNCGKALEAKTDAFFGNGKDNIWLDDVRCSGQEASILKCQHGDMGQNNCGHNEDAGVICSEHLRVVNGSNRCNGRVETFHDGQWKRMCNAEWRKEEADVVCREMYCGTAKEGTAINFGQAHDLLPVKGSCLGNESSISECTVGEYTGSCIDATVDCSTSKPIRLKNGTNRCSGRVEIYNNGQWGTVCDDRWGIEEAAVTCREMDCGNPIAVKYKAYFGRGNDHVWLDDMECTGQESSLSDCSHRGFGEHDCDHSEDAGVVCSEHVRLTNGTDRCSGRLEVFQNNQWGKICNNNWSIDMAKKVCQELSCGAPKNSQETTHFGESELKGYTTSCSSNVSSISECTLVKNTGRCESISLSCSGSLPLRLVNGTDRCSGRVEILHDGQWGTVCDDEWDIRDAQVVCRVMDCGTALTAKSSAYFGPGQGSLWLDDVKCFGNETSLMHCRHASLGEYNCGHQEDAGVVCSATIRLINGTDQCSGRVEVHHNGQWSPAFYKNWGANEANVVCREMNCGDQVQSSGSFVQDGPLRGITVTCRGTENSLTQCTVTPIEYVRASEVQEATVKCSGSLRLVDGQNRCAGRVQFYDNNQWGVVCGEAWDVNDATVVCNQLDCGRPHIITHTAERGPGTELTLIEQIECTGRESTLAQCQQRSFRTRTCNSTSIAGVVCTGSLEVRLSDGKDECTGRVEVRHGNVWQTVCDTEWTQSKAEMVCKQLECGHAVNTFGSAHFGHGSGAVVEASDSCFANETSLQQCSLKGFRSSSCGHERDAGVVCAAPVRLVGGSGQCSGRVEIFYKGQWGTVCDDEWEVASADVVCRQLGCGHAVSAPTSAHFGRGSGPIWLDNVECTGSELSVTQCPHNGIGENNCGHGEDASAVCLGALGKPQITLSPAPEVNWGDKVEITCTIVTEHTGGTFFLKKTQGSFQMEKFSDNEAATFTFPTADFSHKGSYFCEYHKKIASQTIYYPQGETTDLSVTVKLETPSLTLSSPYAMVVYSPDEIAVKKGNSFSITCSIHSKYPGGVFYLTKSNTTIHETKPTFGHTIFYLASFEFPSLELENQGKYTCVYAVNISSQTFCSVPSKSLQVNVGSSPSSVVSGLVVGTVVLLLVLVIGYLVWRRRWRGVGTLVQFSNRFGGAIKQDDADERSNVTFDGRGHNSQVTEHGPSYVMQDKIVDFDSGNSVEKVPEDLAGRVCYEHEPLVLS